MVAAASTMKTGAPVASGATARTASTKRCRTALSLPSPLGATSILTSPSGATQSLLSDGRKRVDRDVLGLEEVAHLVERGHERRDQRRAPASSRVAGGAFAKAVSAPASRRACVGGGGVLAVRRRSERSAAVLLMAASVSAGVGAGSTVGIERVLEEEARVVDDRELLVLVLRHEALQRPRPWRPPAAARASPPSPRRWRGRARGCRWCWGWCPDRASDRAGSRPIRRSLSAG